MKSAAKIYNFVFGWLHENDLKNLILFFFLHEQLYIKGTLFFKNQSFRPISEIIGVPWLVNHSHLWSTGIGQMHCGPKEEKLAYTTNVFFFLITKLYIVKAAQGNSSLKMQGRETLAPNAVKLGKMQRNDASV